MRVLVGCEMSGTVRDAFADKGHDAWSCDTQHTDKIGNHIKGDVRQHLNDGWDLFIAHPPCTHLTGRGVFHCKRRNDEYKIEAAVEFFMEMYNASINAIAVENPVGIMSSRFRKPDQYIQPWHFGHSKNKKTGLGLKNLPVLTPTKIVPAEKPVSVDKTTGKKRYFTDSVKGKHRAIIRAITFQGIADAMAEQWANPPQPINHKIGEI